MAIIGANCREKMDILPESLPVLLGTGKLCSFTTVGLLLEIFYCGGKKLHIVAAGNIFIKSLPNALRVTHFSENTAIR